MNDRYESVEDLLSKGGFEDPLTSLQTIKAQLKNRLNDEGATGSERTSIENSLKRVERLLAQYGH